MYCNNSLVNAVRNGKFSMAGEQKRVFFSVIYKQLCETSDEVRLKYSTSQKFEHTHSFNSFY